MSLDNDWKMTLEPQKPFPSLVGRTVWVKFVRDGECIVMHPSGPTPPDDDWHPGLITEQNADGWRIEFTIGDTIDVNIPAPERGDDFEIDPDDAMPEWT